MQNPTCSAATLAHPCPSTMEGKGALSTSCTVRRCCAEIPERRFGLVLLGAGSVQQLHGACFTLGQAAIFLVECHEESEGLDRLCG
mmetsp:Transcript_13992/g.32890  ORF Transcript_13992/g.32890 Transcript_13992/m.32890 type:complete len:86 (+) Transcript_13992:211-468(+)